MMSKRAFTLVEVLVALAVLSVGLVPAFYHVTAAVLLSTRIRDSLVSANLAQEGLEIIRSYRDANWFNDREYDEELVDLCSTGCRAQYSIQYGKPELLQNDAVALRLDPATGLYQYDRGSAALYSRVITITPDAGGLRVDSTVSWTDRGRQRQFTARSYLYNWIQ